MLLSTAFNEPFKAEKRILLRLAVVPFLPFNLLSCSYLNAFFQSLAKDDLDMLSAFGLTMFCYAFIIRPNPIVLSAKIAARYKLQQRMRKLRGFVTLAQAWLGVQVLVLHLVVRFVRFRNLYRAAKAMRSTQEYRALSADASRASKDSARYKSLLKRYE